MIKAPGFLKQNFTAPVLAGLMVLAPIGGKLGNLFGGTAAHAQDSAEAATLPPDFNKTPVSIPQPKISVPIIDGRMAGYEAVNLKAADISGDSIILLVYGMDQNLMNSTIEVFRNTKELDPNTPLKAIIVGPTDLPAGVDVIANGQTYNTRLLANKDEISYVIMVTQDRLEEDALLASKLVPNHN